MQIMKFVNNSWIKIISILYIAIVSLYINVNNGLDFKTYTPVFQINFHINSAPNRIEFFWIFFSLSYNDYY